MPKDLVISDHQRKFLDKRAEDADLIEAFLTRWPHALAKTEDSPAGHTYEGEVNLRLNHNVTHMSIDDFGGMNLKEASRKLNTIITVLTNLKKDIDLEIANPMQKPKRKGGK